MTAEHSIFAPCCPRHCKLLPGQTGACGVRINIDGEVQAKFPNRVVSFNVDPIEKKPLYHFYPASLIASFACAGCNLKCKFCQNWQISQQTPPGHTLEPAKCIEISRFHHCDLIAYTYTDPVVFPEFVRECSKRAHEFHMKNVIVSAGYVDGKAREELYENIDAANIDLKAFCSENYKKACDVHHWEVILDTLCFLKEKSIWTEVTTLLIPGFNDSERELKEEFAWLVEKLGKDTVLHLSAFRGEHLWRERQSTSLMSLLQAQKWAFEAGLHFVYLGNVPRDSNTYCSKCNALLVERSGYGIGIRNMEDNVCAKCHGIVPGKFGH